MNEPIIGITGRTERSARPPNIPLYAISQVYVHVVALESGAPVVIPPHLEEDALRTIFVRLDGLLLSGGGDIRPSFFGEQDSGLLWTVDERRDRTELMLARWALEDDLPVLAICRGHQVLNVAAGGTLIQDISTQTPDALTHTIVGGSPKETVAHTVEVTAGSRLSDMFGAGSLGVNSAHHQAVKDVGAGLTVTARAPDGIIEGLERRDHPYCIGVQWHPEVMIEAHPPMRQLFAGLIQAATARTRAKGSTYV